MGSSYWFAWSDEQLKLREKLRKIELESEQLSVTGRFRCVPIPARSPLVSGSWLPSTVSADSRSILEKAFFRMFNVEEEREETVSGMDRKSSIKSRLAQLELELASLEQFPADDFADGTVVTFDRLLAGTVYSYAAIKARGDFWYVTGGGSAQHLTWTALTEWIADTFTGTMYVMTRGRAIAGEELEHDADEFDVKSDGADS